MPNFSKNYPNIKSVNTSTKQLTETNISENIVKAKNDALNILEDFGKSIENQIEQAVDNVINSITNTAYQLIKTGKQIITNVINKFNDVIEFIEQGVDDINTYISNSINTFSKDDIELELSIDSYIDNEIEQNIIDAENGIVQNNIIGTIVDETQNMSNVDKRDISQYGDKKQEKIAEIKNKCSEKLVKYAEETSQNKFNESNNIYESDTKVDLNNLNYNVINIKGIKITIPNYE